GPDGRVWYTERNIYHVGSYTTDGLVHNEYQTAPPVVSSGNYITAAADGRLFFAGSDYPGYPGRLGAITPDTGSVSAYTIGTFTSALSGVAAGRDGNVWFAGPGDAVGHIGTDGSGQTLISLPTQGSGAQAITAGPGGMWLVEHNANKLV